MKHNKKHSNNIDVSFNINTNNETIEKQDKSPIIPQRSKLKTPLNIFQRELTENQKKFLNIAFDKSTRMMFVSGPSGTTKTWLAVYAALTLINQKKVSDLIYVRSVVECADKSIGLLPGFIYEKMAPYIQPLVDKLEELLPKNEIEILKKEERITGMPISFLRGLNFNAKVLIMDESQNCTYKEILTFITRTGEFSKVFILGDGAQSDINGRSGFIKMLSNFDDEESRHNGIYTFKFGEDDILRSELVRFIINKLNRIS